VPSIALIKVTPVIGARPIEAVDEAGPDRIEGPDENNRNCRGRRLRGECRRRRQRRDQVRPLGHEIGCKSIVMALGLAILDRDVLAL
jgi:hypothetical protein